VQSSGRSAPRGLHGAGHQLPTVEGPASATLEGWRGAELGEPDACVKSSQAPVDLAEQPVGVQGVAAAGAPA
jgi:hypothetical protein